MVRSTETSSNAFPGILTRNNSRSSFKMTGDILFDVNSFGVDGHTKSETTLKSEKGSILVNAAGLGVGAFETSKMSLNAGKDIRLWTSNTNPIEYMEYVVAADRDSTLRMNAGNDITLVNTIQDGDTEVVFNNGARIHSVSGGVTTITGVKGVGIDNYKWGGTIDLSADKGIIIGGDSTNYNGNKVTGALDIGVIAYAGTVTLHSDTDIQANQAVVSKGGTVTFNKGATLNSTKGAILVSNGGTVSAEDTESSKKVNGLISADGMGSKANVVFAGTDSYLTGNVVTSSKGTTNLTFSDTSLWTGSSDTGIMDYQNGKGTENEIGTINLELNDSAVWTMTGSSVITNLSGNGGTVYYKDGGDALQVGTVSGSHTWVLDLDYDDHSQSDMIYVVNGTSDPQTLVVKNLSELNSQMDVGDAVRFATVKNSGGGFTEGTAYFVANGIYNDTLTIDNRTTADDPDADENYDGGNKPSQETVDSIYGGDDATNIYLAKTDEKVNAGGMTPGNASDIVWRYVTDLDTYTKRQGQAQYFDENKDNAMWIRLAYKKLGVDGVGFLSGNQYEIGYNNIIKDTPAEKHSNGYSFAYSYGHGDWAKYGGNLKVRDYYLSFYDTHEYHPSEESLSGQPEWKKDTFRYWDNYFRLHRVKTEYTANDSDTNLRYDGDYHQYVLNLSTEYGKKTPINHNLYWVPQGQLQLSYLGGYDYTDSQGLKVDADHDWSLIGRIGFDLVKELNKEHDSRLYFKASVLHEFLDGNDVYTSALGNTYLDAGNQKGTWAVLGLGYSAQINKDTYACIDYERNFGNDFNNTYSIRAEVNWKF